MLNVSSLGMINIQNFNFPEGQHILKDKKRFVVLPLENTKNLQIPSTIQAGLAQRRASCAEAFAAGGSPSNGLLPVTVCEI